MKVFSISSTNPSYNATVSAVERILERQHGIKPAPSWLERKHTKYSEEDGEAKNTTQTARAIISDIAETNTDGEIFLNLADHYNPDFISDLRESAKNHDIDDQLHILVSTVGLSDREARHAMDHDISIIMKKEAIEKGLSSKVCKDLNPISLPVLPTGPVPGSLDAFKKEPGGKEFLEEVNGYITELAGNQKKDQQTRVIVDYMMGHYTEYEYINGKKTETRLGKIKPTEDDLVNAAGILFGQIRQFGVKPIVLAGGRFGPYVDQFLETAKKDYDLVAGQDFFLAKEDDFETDVASTLSELITDLKKDHNIFADVVLDSIADTTAGIFGPIHDRLTLMMNSTFRKQPHRIKEQIRPLATKYVADHILGYPTLTMPMQIMASANVAIMTGQVEDASFKTVSEKMSTAMASRYEFLNDDRVDPGHPELEHA